MTKTRIFVIGFVILLLVIVGLFITHTPKSRILPEGTKFIFGQKFIVEEKIINETGGEILIQKPNTPIDGIRIVFPAGTSPDNTKVEIGYYQGDWKLADTAKETIPSLPLILNLDKKPNKEGKPIEIYKKSSLSFQVDNDTGRLSSMVTTPEVTYTFRQKNIITFTIFSLQ